MPVHLLRMLQSGRRSRSVNKTQIDIILDRMLCNRSIACGQVKLSRDVLADFWNTLTEDLNNAGPPVKNVTEWKKVWADQKKYVRSKAALNLKIEQETGNSVSSQIKRLSATEQCIFDLVGMKKPVEAMENSLSYGLPDSFDGNETNNEQKKKFKMSLDEMPVEINSDISNCSNLLTPLRQDPFICTDSSNSSTEENKMFETKKRKLFSSDLKSKKLKSQENLCATITEINDSIQNHNKKMKNMIKEMDDAMQKHNEEMKIMMKRLYRSLEEKNDLKIKKLKEMQRHHRVSEHLRLREVESKIEKNKQFIEIEKIKLLKMKRK